MGTSTRYLQPHLELEVLGRDPVRQYHSGILQSSLDHCLPQDLWKRFHYLATIARFHEPHCPQRHTSRLLHHQSPHVTIGRHL